MMSRLAALAACFSLVLSSICPAHETGDGGAHHKFPTIHRPTKFKLVHFPKARPSPDFLLPDLKGNVVRLSDLRGKVRLLNFWATWCPPCVKEMPSLERLYRRFRTRPFEVIAVSMDVGGVKPVREFIEKGKFTFRVLHDAKGRTEKPFGLRGLPISYVIDHRGRMVAGAIGAQNWASKEAFAYFDGLVRNAASR